MACLQMRAAAPEDDDLSHWLFHEIKWKFCGNCIDAALFEILRSAETIDVKNVKKINETLKT